ncbi:hypothetical protein [Amycolatopsis sp. TNS106]|uniref:hypothetical protein n=1 Tax=Amycolatopsis sp. TNS106 TaxID=2861750 RepID=UPI001C58037E|nr:hypothetical protein [Amycolatopsis sp. TNS106]QXV63549.1 hypothetical protein CVV72_41035 [Amycolatopsis sp. TNS106]
MPKPTLTVQNAAIATASVEIKTLTVSGKQVTLAVFRQLLEQPLVLDDGTLAGQPWGVVNYHPDKCGNAAEHWHIVWQDGSDLRRSLVQIKPSFDRFRPDEADDFTASCIYDFLSTGNTPYFEGKPPVQKLMVAGWEGIPVTTGHDFSAYIALPDQGRAVVRAGEKLAQAESLYGGSTSEFGANQVSEAKARHEAAMSVFAEEIAKLGATTDELYTRYRAAVEHEHQRRLQHIAVRDELAQLPQLFIAV